ncbi:MAG TPA: hypothetical protein VF341_07990 [Anaeromyxobacteraceae bacterium]
MLVQRTVLRLDDTQVAQLEELDSHLMLERLALQRESEATSPGAPRVRRERGRALGQTGEPGSHDPGGPAMPPGREAPGHRQSGPLPNETAPEDAIARRLDDADTRAWLRAEEALAPEQREHARVIASEYRARLYDQRDAARQGPK